MSMRERYVYRAMSKRARTVGYSGRDVHSNDGIIGMGFVLLHIVPAALQQRIAIVAQDRDRHVCHVHAL